MPCPQSQTPSPCAARAPWLRVRLYDRMRSRLRVEVLRLRDRMDASSSGARRGRRRHGGGGGRSGLRGGWPSHGRAAGVLLRLLVGASAPCSPDFEHGDAASALSSLTELCTGCRGAWKRRGIRLCRCGVALRRCLRWFATWHSHPPPRRHRCRPKQGELCSVHAPHKQAVTSVREDMRNSTLPCPPLCW